MTNIALAALCALFFARVPQTDASRAPRIERNISYVEHGSADQTLDLYLPREIGFPTVVFIHGGSLLESAERRSSPMYAGVCPQLAARNIACATIDYRLSPTFRWPAMPDDAAAAVKWVKDNIATRGGDPRRIFLFGHSSGCELAAILATNGAYLAKVGLTTADVAGVVPMGCTLEPTAELTARFQGDDLKTRWTTYGPRQLFDSLDDWLSSDPSRYIGPQVPPVLVVLAERERFFPAILEQGARFVRRLLEVGRPADLTIVPGKHTDSIARFGEPGDPTAAALETFIRNPAVTGINAR